MTSRKTRTPDFEQSLADLQAIVEQLEQGDVPLEEALRQFERGVGLSRTCQAALQQAEQKVEILLAKNAGASPEPFDTEE